ncbi:MAG: insulinase family protein [Deltaproteobacteria bacterium]|nr:MAG: insulinase family protein [Deltaproteobacteria bacterium]
MTVTLLLSIAATFAAEPLPFEIHERALDNGLRVVAVETPATGVAAVRTWFSVGSRDETRPGETGYAHFFEHLMFHGTEARPRGTREAQLVSMGAEDNAWTWFDETVYTTTLPSEELDTYLATEADRFANLALTPDGVRREASAVYGEFRKSQSNPDERLNDELYATAFTTHTYQHSTIGYEPDIAGMPEGYESAVHFLREFYRPDRAALIVVGDIQPEAVFTMAETHFGSWTPTEVEDPSPPVAEEPPQEETRRAHVDWPSETAERITMGWRIAAHDPSSEDLALLDLLAAYLDARTGPLYTRLVEGGLVLDAGARRDDFADPGLFKVTARLKEGVALDAVEAAIREVLTEVKPEDLESVRRHSRLGGLLRLESPSTLASAIGWQMRRGDDANALSTWLTTQETADLARLPEVVADTFTDATLTVVTLAPKAEEAQ